MNLKLGKVVLIEFWDCRSRLAVREESAGCTIGDDRGNASEKDQSPCFVQYILQESEQPSS